MDIRNLNIKYFELYAELDEARGVLPAKQYEVMFKALLDTYKTELKVTLGEWTLENSLDTFKLKFDLSTRLPRRFLFWWNPIARKLLRRFRAEFKASLEALSQEPEALPQDQTDVLTADPTPTTLVGGDSTAKPSSDGQNET